MTKLEIIHGNEVLKAISSLRGENLIEGFTTLNVHRGYGPKDGDIYSDFISESHFYTFIILKNEKDIKPVIDELKKRCPNAKYFSFYSSIQLT